MTEAQQFFEKVQPWDEAYQLLRTIILQQEALKEDFKWMHPCYTLNGKNVVLMHGFKEYCALLFHKGALMSDPSGLLIQQTDHVQAARQIRFTSIQQIEQLKSVISEYLQEAIRVEESGQKINLKKVADYPIPPEFQKVINEDIPLQKAFEALTPGRQKGYLFYFNQAKQPKTRIARIEKYYQAIMEGKGLDD